MTDTPAGRELDIEVARVLGIKKIHYHDWDTAKEFPYYIPSGKPWRTHKIDARPLPFFSTTWEGAGLVVARMAADNWTCRISVDSDGTRVWFMRREGEMRSAEAETMPVAVCRAAVGEK